MPEETKVVYLVTDPEERAKHGMTRRKPYVCNCGEEFDRYNDWYKHRTKASVVKRIEE